MNEIHKLDNEYILVTEPDIMSAVSGSIYRLAPNHQPRDIVKIMEKVQTRLRTEEIPYTRTHVFGVNMISLRYGDLMKLSNDLIKDIPEIINLNLSHNEVEAGISVDDQTRGSHRFVSAFNTTTADSWKDDFIDLDALANCIRIALRNEYIISSLDCGGCYYKVKEEEIKEETGDTCFTFDECKHCVCNIMRARFFNYNKIPYNKSTDDKDDTTDTNTNQ